MEELYRRVYFYLMESRLKSFIEDNQQPTQSILSKDRLRITQPLLSTAKQVPSQLQSQISFGKKQQAGHTAGFYLNDKKRQVKQVVLKLQFNKLKIQGIGELLLNNLTGAFYPNENSLSLQFGKFTYNFIFSRVLSRKNFQREVWMHWKLQFFQDKNYYFKFQKFPQNYEQSPQKSTVKIPQTTQLDGTVCQINISGKRKIFGQAEYLDISPIKPLNRVGVPYQQMRPSVSTPSISAINSPKAVPIQSKLNTVSMLSKAANDEVDLLTKGFKCTKYAENGLKPHEKRLFYDSKKEWLVWADIQNAQSYNYIRVADIKQISLGRNSKGFIKYDEIKDQEKEQRSLVILTSKRVLELQMRSKEDRQYLLQGLNRISRQKMSRSVFL